MTLVLSVLRTETREHLGIGDENSIADGSRSLNDAAVDRLINRSFWEISDKFPFRLKEATTLFFTVDGTRRYDMPAPYEALRSPGVTITEDSETGQHNPLERMTKVVYEGLYIDNTDSEALPTNYIREADSIILYPTPDDIYEITVAYWTPFDDLSDANDDPADSVPRVWHEIILFGAVWRGWLRYNNYISSREFKSNQLALINSTTPVESKEEGDSSSSGLSVPEEWNSRRGLW